MLFKYGGTALNLDITVTKSLSKLGKHWFIKDNGSIYPVLKLSNDLIGRAAAGMVMSNLRSQADNGYVNVENAVEAALGDLCSVSDVNKMNNSTCSGYKIYDVKIFRPIDYEQQELYLEPAYVRSNFGYQTWLDAVRILPRDSLYCTIARNFCPFIYGEFMEDFVKDY
ncbi:unnamed protein product [Danaus chrysippus]|uniref:(African queen) hypothetical protein n=1 Tax=Danaus chrysippus TaxID=151541 RepID=A0A8J2QR65_9NEOP|nr:unnamed protein product [Danaus chrysippus]